MAEALISTAVGEFSSSYLTKEAGKNIAQFIAKYGSTAFQRVAPLVTGGMILEKVLEAAPPLDLQQEKLFGMPVSRITGQGEVYSDIEEPKEEEVLPTRITEEEPTTPTEPEPPKGPGVSDFLAETAIHAARKGTEELLKKKEEQKDITKQTKDLVTKEPEFGALTEVEKQTALAIKGDKPDYYSRVAKAVEGSQEIATAKQWLGIIQGQGATEAELDYLGLTELLKGEEKITKENLLKHIKEKDISSRITTTKMPDKDREVVEYEHFRLKGTNTDSFETYVMQFDVTKDEEGKYLPHDEPITYRADASHIGKEQYGRNTFLTLRTQIGYSPSFIFESTEKTTEHNKWAMEIGKLFENTLIGDEIQLDLVQRGRTIGFEKDFDVIKGSDLIAYLDTNNIMYEIEKEDDPYEADIVGEKYNQSIKIYHGGVDMQGEKKFIEKVFTPNSMYIFGHPLKLKAVGEGENAGFMRYDDRRIDRTKPKELQKRITPNAWTGKLSDHINVLPNFPITSDTKGAELGLMELIRIAVENGNDSIAIPSGQILADRYSGKENLKVWQDKILLGVLQKIAKRNNTTVTEHVIQKKKEFTKESGLHVEGTVDLINEAKDQGYSLRKISRKELRKLLMPDGDRPSDRTYVGQEIPDFTSMFTNNQYSRRVESIAEELTLGTINETANVPVTNNTFYVWQNADGLIKFELPIVGGNDAEAYMDDENRDVDTSAYVEGLSEDFTERIYLEYLFNKIEEHQGKTTGTRKDHKLYKMKIPKSLQKKILSESQKFTELKSPIDKQTQRLVA